MPTETTSSTSTLIAALVGLMLLAAALLLIANRIKWPFTVLLVITGLFLHATGIDTLTQLDSFTRPEVATDIILVILLPTLIFESAFNLDASRLRYNWRSIFTLAVPGTVISTLLIGACVGLLTPLPWGVSLLLGAILSATDPVSVIAIFKKLGAPKDITLLVEGESLFNDATAIILCKLLLAALITGIGLTDAVLSGLLSFVVIVVGGITLGGLFGVSFTWIAAKVDDEPFVEITLTLVLAYGSYLLADLLGVSGILATVTAGLVLGSAGRPQLSKSARHYLDNYWSYTAFAANSIIFLLVGLRADLGMILQSGAMLLAVLFAMLFSRAVIIYGLTPLAGRLSRHSHPISYSYRHLLFWGGLRGAITLALALSLEHTFILGDTVVALATGAVLFTVVVQGLTMGTLVRRMKLDQPELTHQLMRLEGWISAYRTAKYGVGNLKGSPELSDASVDDMQRGLESVMLRFQAELNTLRAKKIDFETEWRLFLIHCFTIEISYLQQLSENGYLSKSALVRLRNSLLQQLEALRHDYLLPEDSRLMARSGPTILLMRCFLGKEEYQSWYGQEEYLESWGRAQSCRHLLAILKVMQQKNAAMDALLLRANKLYQSWLTISEARLEELQTTHPDSIRLLGSRQLRYFIISTQRQEIERQVSEGTLTEEIAESMLQELSGEMQHMREGTFSLLPGRIAGLLSKNRPIRPSSID